MVKVGRTLYNISHGIQNILRLDSAQPCTPSSGNDSFAHMLPDEDSDRCYDTDNNNTNQNSKTSQARQFDENLPAHLNGPRPTRVVREHVSFEGQLTAKTNKTGEITHARMIPNIEKAYQHAASLAATNKVTFLAAHGSPINKDTWIIDSGANIHIANNRKWFTDYYSLVSDINTADSDGALRIEGGGEAAILLRDANGPIDLTLSDVAHAPSSRCNLLSLSALIYKANVEIYVNRRGMRIIDQDGMCVGWATEADGLYHLQTSGITIQEPFDPSAMMTTQEQEQNNADKNASKDTDADTEDAGNPTQKLDSGFNFDDIVWKWHRKLGHLSLDSMAKLVKQVEGLPLTVKQIKARIGTKCPICMTTRALVKIPRDPARRKFASPGSLLHCDIWGPYPIRGINDTKYFFFVVDDATRFT